MIGGALVLLAVAILLFGIGIPYLLEYLRGNLAHGPIGSAGKIKGQSAATTHSTAPLAWGTFAGLGGLVTTTVGLIRHVIAAPTTTERAMAGRVGKFAQKHRGLLLSIGASVSVPLFALVSIILAINWGAAHPPFA